MVLRISINAIGKDNSETSQPPNIYISFDSNGWNDGFGILSLLNFAGAEK
jgi:hypothetical protein